jgi:hypothetical protein
LLFVLMTVIWMANHGPNQFAELGLVRIKSSDWQNPVAERSSMPPQKFHAVS